MSLVVALEAKDGVILAGDTRGTIGDPRGLTAIRDTHQKVFSVTSHCAVGLVGSAELGAALLDGVTDQMKAAGHVYIDDVANLLRTHVRNCYGDWFARVAVDARPAVVLTLAGFRDQGGVVSPVMYLLQSQIDFAPMLMTGGTCLTGVPQYATYLANRYYDRAMDKESVAALAVFLINETASQDPKVGGPVNVLEITQAGGCRMMADTEIAMLNDRNAKQAEQLKQFFFGGTP